MGIQKKTKLNCIMGMFKIGNRFVRSPNDWVYSSAMLCIGCKQRKLLDLRGEF